MLLALEVYFQAAGCRFNAVKQMRVDEILNAVKVPEPCPYCEEKTDDFRKHRRRCRKWKKAKRRGQVSRGEGNPEYCREIRFRRHKTFRGVGLPVVVDRQLHDLLVLWIHRTHGEEAPDVRIFEGIRWEYLLTMLKRIVGAEVLAKAKGSGPIGSKAMRQYASTMILKKIAKPHDAMRRIGGSEAMAKRHYQDQRENAYQKLTEKRLLLASSTSSSSSSSGEESEEDNEQLETWPSDGSSNPVRHSESESSTSSDARERPKGKGKQTPGQRTKSSKRVRHPSSSDATSASSPDTSESEELSETITLPPPAEVATSQPTPEADGGITTPTSE